MKTTCEEWGCRYWDKEKGICTDPIDWKNKQGESVCGLRDDALYPTPYFEQSCATGPFIYRTDTGDETGKVVEDTGLPKGKDDTWFLMLYGFDDQCMGLATINDIEKQPKWFRLHCKAYAEIRKG